MSIFEHVVRESFLGLFSKKSFFFQCLVTRQNYSQICRADSDCLPTLICPTISGVCNCSQYLPDLVCNCANTKYYNPILSQCGMKTIYILS